MLQVDSSESMRAKILSLRTHSNPHPRGERLHGSTIPDVSGSQDDEGNTTSASTLVQDVDENN